MILIADSGSTKTDWSLCESGKLLQSISTKGINPFYQSSEEILQAVSTELIPNIENPQLIKDVFFYGAGCLYPDKNQSIKDAFMPFIPDASFEIKSDLYAACHALLGRESGVACILGTGSNSCLYDGKEIKQHVSPLGFILGDEGGGAHLGKLLVSDFLKNQLPDELKKLFFEEFQTSVSEIMENVYRRPFPNRYLASLSRFLSNHIEEPECYNIVHHSFTQFFERNIMQYDISDDMPVNFVGSVAYYYSEILERVASEFGLWIDKIEKSPMSGLITYHI